MGRTTEWFKVFLLLATGFSVTSCTHGADAVAPLRTVPREIEFGGQQWRIKSSDDPVDPGPNYWSASPDAVWVDEEGLHLSIDRAGDRWYATEIFTRRPVGYGTYTFTVDSDVTGYDPHVVAGFFTWDTSPEAYHREIDIEFAAWGRETGTWFQYVVQPYTDSGRLHVFDPKLRGSYTTHRIVWTPQRLEFSSYHGSIDPDALDAEEQLISRWVYGAPPPTEGRVRFRINLWLFEGTAPDCRTELTVKSFSFIPLQ